MEISAEQLMALASEAGFKVFGKRGQIVAADGGSSGEARSSLERFAQLLLAMAEGQAQRRRRVVVMVNQLRVNEVFVDCDDIDVLVVDEDNSDADEGSVLDNVAPNGASLYAIHDAIPVADKASVDATFERVREALSQPDLLPDYVARVRQSIAFGGKNIRPSTAELAGISVALGELGVMGVEATEREPFTVVVSQTVARASTKGNVKIRLGKLTQREGAWYAEVGDYEGILLKGGLKDAPTILKSEAMGSSSD